MSTAVSRAFPPVAYPAQRAEVLPLVAATVNARRDVVDCRVRQGEGSGAVPLRGRNQFGKPAIPDHALP